MYIPQMAGNKKNKALLWRKIFFIENFDKSWGTCSKIELYVMIFPEDKIYKHNKHFHKNLLYIIVYRDSKWS